MAILGLATLAPVATAQTGATPPSTPGGVAHTPSPEPGLWTSIGPLWSTLSADERQILAPFEQQWNGWSVEEKRAWILVVRNRYPGMSEAERLAWHRRIEQWAALNPEQRRTARLNYRLLRRLPPPEQAEEVRRFQNLTPEQRQMLEAKGSTSNTAAGHAGARTGLAKQASQPISGFAPVGTAR